MTTDYTMPVSAEARNVPDATDSTSAGMVRVYCNMRGREWLLQVRGRERLASGRPGARYMVATAHMSRAALASLRNAITDLIGDGAE